MWYSGRGESEGSPNVALRGAVVHGGRAVIKKKLAATALRNGDDGLRLAHAEPSQMGSARRDVVKA
jgi:hypothetical protein